MCLINDSTFIRMTPRYFIVGRSGYTSLSLEEKRYAKLRRSFDTIVNTDKTFTVWVMETLDAALNRQLKLNKSFPGIKWIGNKTGGCILEEKGTIIEITYDGKNSLTCSQDNSFCRHCLFAVLHPLFEY